MPHDFSKLINDIRARSKKRKDSLGEPVEMDERITKEFKEKFRLVAVSEKTYVIAVAVHDKAELNDLVRLPNRGVPIGGYIHDCVSNYCGINGLDYLNLGYVPIAFKLSVEGVSRWEVFLPVPPAILISYLSQEQQTDLKSFSDTYDKEGIHIEFLQMIE
jgi:hypothetical protein